jgi:hypothetical protein
MTLCIRYVVETRRGDRDPDWGISVISRSYFDTKEEAQREVDGRARDGKILGRTYTIKREEFDIKLDGDSIDGDA